MQFKKLILITGASRGIGRALAQHLYKQGYQVSVCARNINELSELQRESQGNIRIHTLDVCNAPALQTWIETECAQQELVPWGLITVAGIHGSIGPFIETSWEEWKQALEVNLYGSAFACKIFASTLVKRNLTGRILLFSGGGATQAIQNLSSYGASKAALVRFGETLALELKDKGITVNAIAPGLVNTALTQTIVTAGRERAGKVLYDKTINQLQDQHGPEKALALCSYLLGEETSALSGKLISAVWDDWHTLHKDIHKILDPHLYTLRRNTGTTSI